MVRWRGQPRIGAQGEQRTEGEHDARRDADEEAGDDPADDALGDDPHVAAIATRLHHTPTQVLLRWALQHGAAVIPTSRTHAADNAAVFDFELDEGDMAAISGMSWFFEVPHRNMPQFADVLAVQTAAGSDV